MWVFAHRGNSEHYPENTLAAIKSALFATDAEGIEIDVYCTKDKQLVVIHDESLERTTTGKGYVSDHTYQQLQTLNAGDGEQIPTLSSVLDLMPDNKWLNIELKGEDTAIALESLLQQEKYKHWQSRAKLLISSFNHHLLLRIRKQFPDIKVGALTASIPLGYAKFAEELQAWSVHCDKQFISQAFVNDAKARRLKVFVYTVDSTKDIQKIKTLGADAIFSNDPQQAKTSLLNF